MPLILFSLALEIPLHTNRGIPEESLRTLGVCVINEVVRELPLRAYAEMFVEVIPQLGLGENDQAAMIVGFLATPEIDEAREPEFIVQEVQAPDTRQLGTGIRVRVIVTLEELLVQQLYGPRLREVSRMAIVCQASEGSLLETHRTVQATVELDMCSKGRLLAQVELTRDFRIGTLCEMTR